MAANDHLPFRRGDFPPEAGGRLRALREGRGASRREVASIARVAPRTLARIERGAQIPNWRTLESICEALGVDVSSIAPRWTGDATDLPDNPTAAPGVGLRALRLARGMTLVELAAAAEVSVSTLSRFERGLIASRALLRGPIGRDQLRVEIDNPLLAAAFGFDSGNELRVACLRAAREAQDAAI